MAVIPISFGSIGCPDSFKPGSYQLRLDESAVIQGNPRFPISRLLSKGASEFHNASPRSILFNKSE